MNGNGPLSPDELARVQDYWSTPALSSSAAAPAPPTAAADYFGPPIAPPPEQAATIGPPNDAPPAGPAPLPEPPGAFVSPTSSQAPPQAPIMSGGPVRQPGPIEREQPSAGVFGPPAPMGGFASSDYAKSHPKSGGAPNADPYGIKGEQKKLLGTFDEQKASMGREGDAEAAKNVMLADQSADLARLKEEDAAIAHQTDVQANEKFESHMAETQRQLDAVRAKKIDPGRYMRDQSGFLALLGGVAGGMYMGLNKLDHNPFLDDLNKHIDRDIDAQKADLANQREGVQNRMSMLGQMRAIYKDHTLAELQARNLYYEATKEKLTAEGARADSPIIQEHTAQAVSAIDRSQSQLSLQIKEQARHDAMAQAAAAAAAARAARKEAFENTTTLIKLGQEDRKLDIEGRKADAEKGDKLTAQTQKIAEELSKPEIVNGKKAIADLKRQLVKLDAKGGAIVNPATGEVELDTERGIPGVGHGADQREESFPPTPGIKDAAISNLIPGYGAANWAGKLTPAERENRMKWDQVALAYQHAVTGAGTNPEEAAKILKAFGGARTPAEQAAAIQLAESTIAEREARIKAGLSDPAGARHYDERVGEERRARPQPVARTAVSDERAKSNVRDVADYFGPSKADLDARARRGRR